MVMERSLFNGKSAYKFLMPYYQKHMTYGCRCVTYISSKEFNWKKRVFPQRQSERKSSYYTFPVFTSTQHALEMFHTYSSLPWWATIVVSTVILRGVITLPLSSKQSRLIAKMELLRPTLKELTDAVRESIIIKGQRAGKSKNDVQKQLVKELRNYTKDFYKRNGVSPWKLFLLPWMQLPLWVTVSFALRNISGYVPKSEHNDEEIYLPAAGIETEGILWFSNLSLADPYYILPVMLLLTNLMNIEMSTLKKQAPSKFAKGMTYIFRGLSGLMFLVATQVPSAMSLYWTCSSSYGLAQNLLIKHPTVRRLLNIPKTPSESKQPYNDMISILKNRALKFLQIQRTKY